MKKLLHPIVTGVLVVFALSACEKPQKGHQSDKPAPSSPENPSDSITEEMTRSVLSKTGFEDPSDGYFHAYLLAREAEKSTNPDESIRNLQEALEYLRAVKKRYPDWKIVMVDARIQKTEESLAQLSTTGAQLRTSEGIDPKLMSGSGRADTDSIGVVGILFQESDPRIVLDLLPDGPAAKAGIRVGDTILRIDGQHIEPMTSSDLTSIEEFTDILRGLPGTDVTLTIKSSDAAESKEFTLTRIPFTLYDR